MAAHHSAGTLLVCVAVMLHFFIKSFCYFVSFFFNVMKTFEYQPAGYWARMTDSDMQSEISAHFNVPDIWKGIKRINTSPENGIEQEREILCLTEQGVYFFLGSPVVDLPPTSVPMKSRDTLGTVIAIPLLVIAIHSHM